MLTNITNTHEQEQDYALAEEDLEESLRILAAAALAVGDHSQWSSEFGAQLFSTLAQQIQEQSTTLRKWSYLQNRLRIGWGTARVAVGMAFGQFVYEELMWRMALENNHDDFSTADGIMVDKPMVAYPTRRPSLVGFCREFSAFVSDPSNRFAGDCNLAAKALCVLKAG
eukprot:scaffold2599_cov210-Chaetoceros_neogracile.AAC.2